MPSTKKAVSFRPDPGVKDRFDAALESVVVDGDDRRSGFGGQPDSITRTLMLEAAMQDVSDKIENRRPGLLRLPFLKAKNARYREDEKCETSSTR